MAYLRVTLVVAALLVVFGVLHYTLPQRDVVRIVDTEVRRMDFGANGIFWAGGDAGSGEAGVNRDVRFIETVRPDGSPSIYRNEDTGWGWPPYFKFDSSDLQARAADLISTRDGPIWVEVSHYGWRSQLLTIFPNATNVRMVGGPDATYVPWGNIAILVALALVAALLWAGIRRLRQRLFGPSEPNEIGSTERRAIWRRWLKRRGDER